MDAQTEAYIKRVVQSAIKRSYPSVDDEELLRGNISPKDKFLFILDNEDLRRLYRYIVQLGEEWGDLKAEMGPRWKSATREELIEIDRGLALFQSDIMALYEKFDGLMKKVYPAFAQMRKEEPESWTIRSGWRVLYQPAQKSWPKRVWLGLVSFVLRRK